MVSRMRRRVTGAAIAALAAGALLGGCAVGPGPLPAAPPAPASSSAPAGPGTHASAAVRPTVPSGTLTATTNDPSVLDRQLSSVDTVLNQVDAQVGAADRAPADAD